MQNSSMAVTSHASAQLQMQMQTTIFVHKFHVKFKQNPLISS